MSDDRGLLGDDAGVVRLMWCINYTCRRVQDEITQLILVSCVIDCLVVLEYSEFARSDNFDCLSLGLSPCLFMSMRVCVCVCVCVCARK